MAWKFQIVDQIGPMEKKLRDGQGRLRSFIDIVYEVYSADARRFLASKLMLLLDNAPKEFSALSKEAKDKVVGVLILELVAKFCESAEDLAAFGISFATELYNDALPPEEVWTKLAEYRTGDIVNFYRDIGKRNPEYFANLHGYPPLALQRSETGAVLLRSCRQMAAYLGHVSEAYLNLRELQNAHKHGMRVFFGSRRSEQTGEEAAALSYIDEQANVKAMEFPQAALEELYGLCDGIGQLLEAMLYWHRYRIQATKSRNLPLTTAPVFGMSSDKQLNLQNIYFPSLFDLREYYVSKASEIASKKQEEISKLRKGEIVAIDVDSEEIFPCNTSNVREAIWKALESRPTARLTLRRITPDGKVGPY